MSYPVLFPYVHPFTSCRTAMETYYITHVLKQPVNTAWPSRLEICNDITWHVSNLWKFWSLNLSFASLNLSYEHKWTKCLGATDISRACQGITCQRRSGPWQEPGQHGAGAQAAGERRTNGLQLRRPRQSWPAWTIVFGSRIMKKLMNAYMKIILCVQHETYHHTYMLVLILLIAVPLVLVQQNLTGP